MPAGEVAIEQGSLTGGPRSGSGTRSRPVRTRIYSQNKRFWFKTWRGPSICNRRRFCSRYGSCLADEKTHRPIACELSHPAWYYSANQVCAFKVVNIATLQCRQMREIEASYTWKDSRKKQTDRDTGKENKGRETEEWDGEKERNVRNKWRSPKKEKWTAKIEHLIRNGQTHFCSYFPLGALNLCVSYVQKLWHLLKVPMWNAIMRQNITLLNKPTHSNLKWDHRK